MFGSFFSFNVKALYAIAKVRKIEINVMQITDEINTMNNVKKIVQVNPILLTKLSGIFIMHHTLFNRI